MNRSLRLSYGKVAREQSVINKESNRDRPEKKLPTSIKKLRRNRYRSENKIELGITFGTGIITGSAGKTDSQSFTFRRGATYFPDAAEHQNKND